MVGIERSPEAVELAQRFVRERALDNVEVVLADARSTGLPGDSFDLATARLVLVNVPDPEQIIAEAVALVRSGGTVAFHEADWIAHLCDPPIPEWNLLVEVVGAYSRLAGIDLYIGRKVPRLLRKAGLVEIRVNPIVHAYPPGHARRSILLDFVENLSERLLGQRLITTDDLDSAKQAVRHHLDRPETLVLSHLYVQAWGQKP